jgi:serine/threonine protein kinase
VTLRSALEAKASKIKPCDADTVIANVYRYLDHRRNTVTRGEIVVPGTETKRDYPKTAKLPFHFKKTFTPASAPVKRGETPEIEFIKTLQIHAVLANHVPEPLGYSEWVYRSAVVLGQTLNALSPFADLSYEDAVQLHLPPETLREHAASLIRGCELVKNLHEKGFIHGDLHLDNLMRGEDEKMMLIDLAASSPIQDLSLPEVSHARADDLSELYRDLVLTQFHIGRIEEAPAQKSVELIDDLFPPEIVSKLSRLRRSDVPDRNKTE